MQRWIYHESMDLPTKPWVVNARSRSPFIFCLLEKKYKRWDFHIYALYVLFVLDGNLFNQWAKHEGCKATYGTLGYPILQTRPPDLEGDVFRN